MKFRENVSLAKYSNYKIGGNARFFFEPKTEAEIRWAVRTAKAQKLPIFILGGGTNILFSEVGWDGLVLRPMLRDIKVQGAKIAAGAGASMADILTQSARASLAGFEWAGGLPGFLGGAIRGNAGCFGGEIKDIIQSVRSFDIKTMKVITRTARACGFGYRMSVFKRKNGSEIILSATFQMKKGEKKQIAAAIKEKIDYRARTQPLEYPNIGSIFKNIPLASVHEKSGRHYKKALSQKELIFRGSKFSVKDDPFPVISTAKMIAESGLRGVSFGGALISSKHPNFIVNALSAASDDVKNLIVLAKSEVYGKFGVQLEEEIQTL